MISSCVVRWILWRWWNDVAMNKCEELTSCLFDWLVVWREWMIEGMNQRRVIPTQSLTLTLKEWMDGQPFEMKDESEVTKRFESQLQRRDDWLKCNLTLLSWSKLSLWVQRYLVGDWTRIEPVVNSQTEVNVEKCSPRNFGYEARCSGRESRKAVPWNTYLFQSTICVVKVVCQSEHERGLQQHVLGDRGRQVECINENIIAKAILI